MARKWGVLFVAGAMVMLLGLSACMPPLDTTRTPTDEKTFGQIVYTIGCQHLAFQLDPADVEGNDYRAMCRDGAPPPAGTPPALLALNGHRAPLIPAIDAAAPAPLLPDLQALLVAMTPLYDDTSAIAGLSCAGHPCSTIEAAIFSLGEGLTAMSGDAPFVAALSHLDGRLGYRPLAAADGIVQALLEYPALDDFTDATLDFIGPAAAPGHAPFESLVAASAAELEAAAPADATDPARTLLLARDFLFTEDAAIGAGVAHPIVLRDGRGIGVVPLDPIAGTVPAPFADVDGDGLPDVDAFGRYVDGSGAALDLAPFSLANGTGSLGGALSRDALGQALGPSGAPLFHYVDLDRTVLAAVVRDGLELLDPVQDTALSAIVGSTALLGARVPATAMVGGQSLGYLGFDTQNSALLDLAYAFTQLLGDPHAGDTLELVRTLLAGHESETARVVKALLDAKDLANADPVAAIPRTSDLYDEMVPLLISILETPGLVDDLIDSIPDWDGSGRTVGAARGLAQLLSTTDRYELDSTSCGSPPTVCDYGSYDADGSDFSVPVDRTRPDVLANRSLFERLLHLIHDANGVQYCSKAGAVIKDPYFGFTLQTFTNPCDGMEIDDLAVFFLEAIGGTAQMMCAETPSDHTCAINTNNLNWATSAGLKLYSDPLEQLTTIRGLDQATPESLARVLYLNPSPTFLANLSDPAVCSDGDLFLTAHADTLPALEHNGLYGDLYPLVHAFAIHGAPSVKILANLFALFHEHWPSAAAGDFQNIDPTAHGYATLDGAESYEPLVATILQGDLVPGLVKLIPDVLATTLPSGTTGLDALHNAGNYLFDPRDSIGLAYRNGMTETYESDGTTLVTSISPYYLMADAYAEKRSALDGGGAAAAAWQQATSTLDDILLAVDLDPSSGSYALHDRNFLAVTLHLLSFLEGRVAAHQAAGDLTSWLESSLPASTQSLLAGPVYAALADFAIAIESDPTARGQLYGLLRYLTDEIASDRSFRESLTGLADIAQIFLDDVDLVPIAQRVGQTLDPSAHTVESALALLTQVRRVDGQHVVPQILRNLWGEIAPGELPIGDITTALGETNRATPGTGGPYTGADFAALVGTLGNFFVNDDHGLERFVDIVRDRNGP